MDTDIRPQDDLFGHVNGRWLAETEIPSDRSSWGPFVQLADVCEQQVRDIITDLRRRRRSTSPTRRPQDRRPLQLLHGHRADRDPRPRPGPRAARRGVRPARRTRPGGVPRRVRAESAATASSARTSTPTTATPTATCSTSSRAASACRTRATTATTSSPRSARPTSPTSTKLLTLGEHADPEGAAQRILALDTELAKGHWERAETRDVQKTYNLRTGRRAQGDVPGVRLGRLHHQPRRQLTASTRRSPRCACASRRTSSTCPPSSTESPIEAWRDWMYSRVLRVRGAVPPRRLRRDQLRLLRPHAVAARPSCAPAGSARSSFVEGAVGEAVGKEYVARHFPPRVQGDDGRPGRQPARGLPGLDRGARLDDARRPSSGPTRSSTTFRPKIGYPEKFRDYSKLGSHPTT